MKRLLLAALTIASLAAACSDDSDASDPRQPTQTPTAEKGAETPTLAPDPGLFIVDPATGDGTTATPGTRCWADTCVDYIGPITRADPVDFEAGATLGWQAEGGTVDTISHAWLRAADFESEITSDGTRAWRISGGEFSDGDILVPSEPGDYLLLVFTTYTNGGDVSWGVYVTAE